MQGFPLRCSLALLFSAGIASAQERARVDALGDPLPAGAVARLGSVRLRPGMWVTHLAFSPDGKRLASWSDAGLSLWDAATGRELRRVERSEARAFAFRWLKDGRGLAVVQLPDNNLFVWEFTDPKAARPPVAQPIFGSPYVRVNEYDAFAISPDGKHLAAGRRLGARKKKARPIAIDLLELVPARRVKDLKRVRSLGPHPGDCLAVAFTPDGRSLLAFTQEHEAKDEWLLVYDPATGEELRRLPVPASTPGRVPTGGTPGTGSRNGVRIPVPGKAFAVAPDGRAVALGPSGGAVSLWDITRGEQKQPEPTPKLKGFQAVAFAENARTLVTANRNSPTRVWDLDAGREVRELGRESGDVSALAVSPDGRRVAVGGENGGIRIWDVTTGADACPVPGHRGPVWQAAVAPDGRGAVTGGDDKTLRFWDLADGRERHRVEADGYSRKDPHYTPDGKAILAGGGKPGLRLWDADTAKPLPVPGALANYAGWPRDFSADGRILLTSKEGVVALWDWPAGRLRREFVLAVEKKRSQGKVLCSGASLSSDGRLVTTACIEIAGDGTTTLEVRDALTGRRLHRPFRSQHRTSWLRFVPDSSSFLEVDFLPMNGPPRVGEGEKPEPLPGLILRDAFRLHRRPDFFAPAPEWQRNTEPVATVAFSPDGRTLATALDGRAITLFEVATGQVRRQLPAGHRGDVTSLAFTPDGRRLISTSRDQTGLVWDVRLAAAAGPASPAEAGGWDGLADMNSQAAYRTMARLAADPEKAVALLRGRLKPAAQPDDAALDRLVADLDAKAFALRNRAAVELDRLGHAVVPGVLARLEKAESLELRRRLEQFLDKHDRGVPPPEGLCLRRALELLEHIGTAQARAVLRDLAGGSPVVRLTQGAAEALRRLERSRP